VRYKGLTGWPLDCCVIFLTLFSRTEGYVWSLVTHLGLIMVLFDFVETIWWARASAPIGCSPQGLGGMSYPFK
jgi:hypothetical protein